MTWLPLMVLGATGVLLRYVVDSWFVTGPDAFPTGTLMINTLGSLIAGFLYGYGFEQERLTSALRIGLLVGFCGGFTTFSGFAVQLIQQIESGRIAMAWIYGLMTPVLCLASAYVGLSFARHFL
jgi:CrcB protein